MWRNFPLDRFASAFLMWRNFPLDNMSWGEFLHITIFFSTDAVCGVCDKYQVCGNMKVLRTNRPTLVLEVFTHLKIVFWEIPARSSGQILLANMLCQLSWPLKYSLYPWHSISCQLLMDGRSWTKRTHSRGSQISPPTLVGMKSLLSMIQRTSEFRF